MIRLLRRRLSATAEGAVAASPSASPSKLEKPLPNNLFHRIADVGRPTIPLYPVLEQWVREGRTVKKHDLQTIIKKLIGLYRFGHALEVPGKSSSPLMPPNLVFLKIVAHFSCKI